MVHPFAERIPEDSEFRVMAESAFGAVDAFRRKVGDVRSNRKLSAEGQLDEIRKLAKDGPLVFFAALRKQVVEERESLAKRREHFEIPEHDRKDVVGAMDRAEIRAWLRTLPIGERIKHAASDPTIAQAVVHSPPVLSGLNDDGHQRAKAFLLEHLHGPELAILKNETEIVDTVATAIDIAETQLKNEFESVKQPEPA